MRWKFVFLTVLYFASVAVRIYPAFVSPITYNSDALLEVRAGQFIADNGNLHFPANVAYNNHHTPVTPFLNALIGAIAQMTGVNVIAFLPFLFPFIISLGVFGWYLLAKKVTGKDEIAAFTALMFALTGTYVAMTALVWKQALGMALMPFALYTYKKRNVISFFILVLMPLIHHYVALITYLIISYEIFYTLYLKHKNHNIWDRNDAVWLAAIIGLWSWLGIYYAMRHFDRLSELSPNGYMWLFISLFVLITLLTIKFFGARYRGIKKKYYIIILVVPLAIYIIYFFVPVFPNTYTFNKYTLIFTIGELLLIPFVTIGYIMLFLTEHKEKKMYIATLMAPIHMILFFFLRGFCLESYVSLSRTFDFTDFSWFTGVSTAAYTRKRKVVAFAAVAILVSTTTPLTYFSMQAFGVDWFVYGDEYHTAEWIHKYMGNITVDTDNRLGLIARKSFDVNVSYMLPYELKNGITPASDYWLVSDMWSSGAQMSPLPPIKVNVEQIKERNSVLFSTGRTYLILNNTE